MLVKESRKLNDAIQKKDVGELAEICIGWTSEKNYTLRDAFFEGLAIGAQRPRPKHLFSAKKDVFTFYFATSEKKALRRISALRDT